MDSRIITYLHPLVDRWQNYVYIQEVGLLLTTNESIPRNKGPIHSFLLSWCGNARGKFSGCMVWLIVTFDRIGIDVHIQIFTRDTLVQAQQVITVRLKVRCSIKRLGNEALGSRSIVDRFVRG